MFNTHDTDRKLPTKRWKHTWVDPRATDAKRKRAQAKGESVEDVADVEAWQVTPKSWYLAFVNHIDVSQILLKTKLNKLRQLQDDALTVIYSFKE